MNRRTLLSLAGAGAIGMTSYRSRFAEGAEDSTDHSNHHRHSDCAEAAAKCTLECGSCAAHCGELLAAGQGRHAKTMKFCADCSDICATTAQIASRSGPLLTVMATACESACEECAEACRAFPEDRHMQACREACLACAKACHDMLATVRGGIDKLKREE